MESTGCSSESNVVSTNTSVQWAYSPTEGSIGSAVMSAMGTGLRGLSLFWRAGLVAIAVLLVIGVENAWAQASVCTGQPWLGTNCLCRDS